MAPIAGPRSGKEILEGELPKHGSATETARLPPNLNYLAWSAFQASIEQEESFGIDVLLGEPGSRLAFTARSKSDTGTKQGDSSVNRLGHDATQGRTGGPPPPPPERIRINPRPLIRILSIIHQSALSPKGKPLLLFRPFKGLVAYDKKIREWAHRLGKRLGQQSAAPSSASGKGVSRGEDEDEEEPAEGDIEHDIAT